MPIVPIDYTTSHYIPISPGCCTSVYLCIDTQTSPAITGGRAFILAQIENTGRYLGSGGMYRYPSFENPRCDDVYQYIITYDTSQFVDETDRLSCSDILDVFPYACELTEILRIIDTLPDWVVDSDNVTQTVDQATGQFDVEIPIIDRVNANPIGTFTLTLGALFDDTASDLSAFGATTPGAYTFTRSALLGGGTETVQIVSQDVNNAITSGTDNGAFLCVYPNAVDSGADTGAPVSTDIASVGTVEIVESSLITISNVNTCRAKLVQICWDLAIDTTLLTTGVWDLVVETDIDAAGYSETTRLTYGPFGADMKFPIVIPIFENYTIPASGSLTLQKRVSIETTVGTGAGSLASGYALGYRYIAVGG